MKLSHPNRWSYGGDASDRYFCVGGHGCAHNAENRERIVGANRYDTAYKLTQLQPSNGVALVVSGRNFPDALAASGLAASLDADLILSDGKRANLPSNVNRVILVGGSSVLPDSIEYYTR